ncbi:MAG: TetR/AcrR family transcriptional regulator [Myxococcales bacterium]|nr:TetR/AcrR family transcriptional regulator [Myxococcales bacterium]
MSDPDPKSRILDHALRLFAHNGYGSTSVRQVAEAAGITKPTLYYHFGSKEGLYRAIVESRLDTLAQLVDDTVHRTAPAVDRLEQFLETYLLGAIDDLDTVRFMLTCSLPASDDHPDCHVVGRHMHLMEPLSEVIQQGIDAGELRKDVDPHCAVAALVGSAQLFLLAAVAGIEVTHQTVRKLLNTWLHGVSA